jgi:hypothetical protein
LSWHFATVHNEIKPTLLPRVYGWMAVVLFEFSCKRPDHQMLKVVHCMFRELASIGIHDKSALVVAI